LALHAIGLISKWLRVAVAYPDDVEARGQMLIASTLAGIAFSHSMVGIVHAVAHSLGGVYHLPHGLANAIILPYGMEHNLSSCPERYADIAVALGQHRLPSTRLTAMAGITRVRMLSRQLAYLKGLQMNLELAGIGDDLARLDEVVDTAMADGSILYNPAKVGPDDIRSIVQRAYKQPAQGWPQGDRRRLQGHRRPVRRARRVPAVAQAAP
jgi:alcohol dehydrogenase class IV